jgi:V8-like Glu-specific endopeptidase
MSARLALSLAFTLALPTAAHAITNGTNAPTITPLTAGQILAIGFLRDAEGQFCTGTVIRNEVVLTAYHCVDGRRPEDLQFGIGPAASPLALLDVKRISMADWETDIALIQLDGSATSVGGLQVIPIHRTPLDEGLIDERVEIAGYAAINGISLRHFAVLTVTNVFESVALDGFGVTGACKGDSGGPFLLVDDTGRVTVGGGASSGNLSCRDKVYYSRVDRLAAWVDQELAWFSKDTNDGSATQGSRVSAPEPWDCAAGGAPSGIPIVMAIAAIVALGARGRHA